tara:strand:- start:16684 stop:17019 length:336 start_codon:yes stop_codon:yes gene_type:complete
MVGFAKRPWGSWEVLYVGDGCKVKRLIIKPGQSISRQYHNHRTETWNIITGRGILETGYPDLLNKMQIVGGDTFTIRKKEVHKVINNDLEDLVAIEVQTGPITEEDDIVRI